MANSGSIFEASATNTDVRNAASKPKAQAANIIIPKRRFNVNYPIFRDIMLAAIFLVALPLEMFAGEMYKPSTWLGTRLGQMSGQQTKAQADDQIEVLNRTAIETADSKADAASISAAEQADIQLIQQARIKSVLAEIDQQIQLANTCENEKLSELHKAEVFCETNEQEPYAVCRNRVRTIRDRACPVLPDPSVYPENLRSYANERVMAAKALRNREKIGEEK